MRIACVYLPSFPLQVHVRRAPHLAGKSVIIASEPADDSDHPIVVACSRAAYERGIRAGMSVVRARALDTDCEVRTTEPAAVRQAIEATADTLLALSTTVDLGVERDEATHRAIYLHVPTGTRGNSFGNRIIAQLSRQGFRARVGIADDRFAAWAAAATARGARLEDDEAPMFAQTCTSVPRGGSAAFLAPMSISLLPIDPDVRDMLRSLGIVTLGDFAALPPPSMGRRWNDRGVDLRELARGDDPSELQAFSPRGPVRECVELERPVDQVEPLAFVLRPLLDRVCDRLSGRGTAADRLVVRLIGEAGTEVIPVEPERPTLSARELASAARATLSRRQLVAPIESVEVAVLRDIDIDSSDFDLAESRSDRQLFLSPLLRPTREPHRRTLRRGKKNRRRRPAAELRGLFD